MKPPVHVSCHPLILDALTRLRDRATPPPLFRQLVRTLGQLLFYEACADLPLAAKTVDTPLAAAPGQVIDPSIALLPILRAGLGLADAIIDLCPFAQVWHLGLYRDHDTQLPVTYYNRLPPRLAIDLAFVLDPMLATGGSASAAIAMLKHHGIQRIKFLALIAAPEGVAALEREHPDVAIYLGAIDSHLDENAYIVPGLGDAGDRQFNTGVG